MHGDIGHIHLLAPTMFSQLTSPFQELSQERVCIIVQREGNIRLEPSERINCLCEILQLFQRDNLKKKMNKKFELNC